MAMLTKRLPSIVLATCTLFFGALTYYFQFHGDGGADGLSMYFFIIFSGIGCLGFLLLFLGVLFFTNKGDNVFKSILLILVILFVGYVASVVFNPSIDDFEIETVNVID
jgi:hypothetical protein